MFSNDLGLSQDLIDAVRAITEASCSAKKMEKEELHPNQVKLDKNKNGKLDADDFKRLRKEEETDESYVSNAQRKAVWASKNEKGVKEAKDGWSKDDSLAKPVTSGQAMANHSQYFTKVTKLDSDGNPKKPVKEQFENLEEADGTVNSGRAQHDLDGDDEKKEHADYMKKKHNVTTKYHSVKGKSGASYDDELSYHGSKENVKKAIKDHYGPSMGQEAKEFHPHLFKEEVEELDELSKGTLANYTQKAAHDVGNKMYRAGLMHVTANVKDSEGSTDLGNYYDKTAKASHSKALTRLQGIKTAAKKLAKEEFTLEDYSLEEIQDFMMSEDFEQLDELSKATLGSYVKKATDDYTDRETRISRALDNSNKMFLDPNINKAAVKQANRKLGMNKAIDKLTKEQVEEIEMLAAKHGLGE